MSKTFILMETKKVAEYDSKSQVKLGKENNEMLYPENSYEIVEQDLLLEQEEIVSECAEIQENIPVDELEQYARIEEIVKGLNIAEVQRLKENGYTSSCFFNPDGSANKNYVYCIKEKKKYFYLDIGGSGAFMIDKETGNIFGIKGYGTINKAKCYGHIQTTKGEELHKKRFS